MRNQLLLVVLTLASLSSVQAAGPTGLLNDTGQTQCYTGSGYAACDSGNSGDGASYPRQDGRFGRDPGAANPAASGLTKPAGSGGNGGFAFAPLDVSGNPIALSGDPPVPSATPRCIWDRVTNLVWEVKTDDNGLQDKDWTYGWGNVIVGTCYGSQSPAGCSTNNYITAVNTANLCGRATWRLPTYRELTSIADFAYTDPAIHPSYFPNTIGGTASDASYWTSDAYGTGDATKYGVSFYYMRVGGNGTGEAQRVRLVANGP